MVVPVQVDGKVRATMELRPEVSRAEAVARAREVLHDRGWEFVSEPARVVYVPERVVNFVTQSS